MNEDEIINLMRCFVTDEKTGKRTPAFIMHTSEEYIINNIAKEWGCSFHSLFSSHIFVMIENKDNKDPPLKYIRKEWDRVKPYLQPLPNFKDYCIIWETGFKIKFNSNSEIIDYFQKLYRLIERDLRMQGAFEQLDKMGILSNRFWRK